MKAKRSKSATKETSVKNWPQEERPRERLIKEGAEALTNTELLMILLRTGSKEQPVLEMAKSILTLTQGIKHLNEVSVHELQDIPGIGISKAVQILASIELGKRVSQELKLRGSEIQEIKTPKDCFDLLGNEMQYLDQENFIVLSLDIKQRLIAKDIISKGTINATVVHQREVFQIAVRRLAASIVCVHNHPSGDVKPSREDIMITKQIAEAGRVVGIPLRDHVIIGRNDYSSLKAHGYM